MKSSDKTKFAPISWEINISRRIVSCIRNANATEDFETLEKMLAPINYKLGRSTVLTPDEEAVLVSRLLYDSKRGFILDID